MLILGALLLLAVALGAYLILKPSGGSSGKNTAGTPATASGPSS